MCVHEKLVKNFDQFWSTKGPKKYGWSLFCLVHDGDSDSRILDKIQVYLNEEFFRAKSIVSIYFNWNFWSYKILNYVLNKDMYKFGIFIKTKIKR